MVNTRVVVTHNCYLHNKVHSWLREINGRDEILDAKNDNHTIHQGGGGDTLVDLPSLKSE